MNKTHINYHTKNDRKFFRTRILFLLAVISVSISIAGCGQKKTTEIEVKVISYNADSGAIVDIPKFVQKDGEELSSLTKLNSETDKLINLFDDAQENDNRRFECHVAETKTNGSYIQTTCWWNETGSLMNDGTNLMTLAYDSDSDKPITCKEALKMTDITGVDLVRNVTDAYKRDIGSGQVGSTDMQGFVINKKGHVTQIYMKLMIRSEEDGEEEEHFYSYHLKDKTLTPLNQKDAFSKLP